MRKALTGCAFQFEISLVLIQHDAFLIYITLINMEI